MGKLLFPLALIALILAQTVEALPAIMSAEQVTRVGQGNSLIVLVQVRRAGHGANRGGGGGQRQFNANGFQRNVSGNRNVNRNANVNRNNNVNVNRNVNVNNYGGYHGNYGPNWGGVAAGVAVGVGLGAAATAAANASAYPPPPPYPYAYPPY